jgi:hypothetical protein
MSLSRVTRSVTPARVRSGQTDFAYLKITGKEGRAIQKQVDALEAGKTAGIEPKPMQAGAVNIRLNFCRRAAFRPAHDLPL